LLLPFVLSVIGLGVTSATEVVVFALACMALNILVGYTGLTSFGHGAWFGLAAYAAGMSQRDWFAARSSCRWRSASRSWSRSRGVRLPDPAPARRVLFTLTLALSAMLYSVAFRWTDVTGGENGLGGITRPVLFGVSFEGAASYYALVAEWRSSPCWRCGASTDRPWAACWWRSARTSSAPASSAIPPIASSSPRSWPRPV
jgi:hypothetical protein